MPQPSLGRRRTPCTCKSLSTEPRLYGRIDLRPDGLTHLGHGTAAAYTAVRDRVSFLARDRETTPDIEALADLIQSGELLEAVRDAVGDDFD